MNADLMFGSAGDERAITCLGCGASRSVSGEGSSATGACTTCGYLGWTYAAEQTGGRDVPEHEGGSYPIASEDALEAYLEQ